MEKTTTTKSKGNKILKYLRRPASFSISTAPIRPENNNNNNKHRFSGPLAPVIPQVARRRTKSGRSGGGSGLDNAPEPTSPKVSCIGQIKLKKARSCRRSSSPRQRAPLSSGVRKVFGRNKPKQSKTTEKEAVEKVKEKLVKEPVANVGLGQLRKFSSGRDALAGFDWTKVEGSSDVDSEDDESLVFHSAPILIGGGGGRTGAEAPESRKEINLWKRRTAAPPVPLQL